MKSLVEQLTRSSYIKHYNTISVVLLAVFANSMSQLYIDFEQCVDWLYIIKQLMLLFAVISFQKFYFLLDFYYSGAEKDFYNASKKVRATMSIESIYHSNVLGKIKKNSFLVLFINNMDIIVFFSYSHIKADMQIIINIIITFTFYLLIGYSFWLIYSVVKFFNLTHAAYITISAYLTYSLVNQTRLHILMAMLLAIGITIGIGILLEQYLFGPIKRKNAAPMSLMIISLGTYIALQNCISLIWGDLSLSIRFSSIQAGYNIFGGHITLIQIISISILLGMFLVTNVIIYHCKTGRNIRAVSDNPELSNIIGINSEKTTLWVCGISSFLAAIVGILYALDTDMAPVMGFNLLLYGVVAMIIGGTGNSRGLVGGSLLLSSAQHLAAYFIGSEWINAIAYIFLILFLLYRPLGFSGIRQKKTEL